MIQTLRLWDTGSGVEDEGVLDANGNRTDAGRYNLELKKVIFVTFNQGEPYQDFVIEGTMEEYEGSIPEAAIPNYPSGQGHTNRPTEGHLVIPTHDPSGQYFRAILVFIIVPVT